MPGSSPIRPVKNRERTIAFYEVVDVDKQGETSRMDQVSWDQVLKMLEGTKLGDRVYEGKDKTLIGGVLCHDGEPHLKLMSVRDESAWISIYRPDAESINDLETGNSALLETSIISFLAFGNVLGMIQGSRSAPSAGAVAEWFNGLGLVSGKVETQALISEESARKLRQSSEAARIETRVHTSRAEALERHGSRLSGIMRTIRQEYGPMTVTIILQASRAKASSEGRHMLKEEAFKLSEATDDDTVESAKAKLIYLDADEEATTEEVNFVKQKITAKRRVCSNDAPPTGWAVHDLAFVLLSSPRSWRSRETRKRRSARLFLVWAGLRDEGSGGCARFRFFGLGYRRT